MNINLPGGKGKPSDSPSGNLQPQAPTGRAVRIDYLSKLSDVQIQAKLNRLPLKLKKKAEGLETRINRLRARFKETEDYYKRTESVCREIIEKRKQKPVPNQPKAAA